MLRIDNDTAIFDFGHIDNVILGTLTPAEHSPGIYYLNPTEDFWHHWNVNGGDLRTAGFSVHRSHPGGMKAYLQIRKFDV